MAGGREQQPRRMAPSVKLLRRRARGINGLDRLERRREGKGRAGLLPRRPDGLWYDGERGDGGAVPETGIRFRLPSR